MKNQYVLLTGGKNNAGDFLIKKRVNELLCSVRADRNLINFDAWKPLTADQLRVVNESKALILAGGPALQYHMRPNIYPLVENLEAIKVPIILMGVGWKSIEGSWQATYDYPLSEQSLMLLRKIDSSGYLSSVRDYHTLNSLFNHGFKNVLMTGCPALYCLDHVNKGLNFSKTTENISFSVGVSFAHNAGMEKQMKEVILKLKGLFPSKTVQVVFHHTLDKEVYLKIYPNNGLWAAKHEAMSFWLDKQGIEFLDISGDADTMLNHYLKCDLHVGYRVHAHILMSSLSKPSVLLNEDGRGKALKEVIGGLIFDAYNYKKLNQRLYSKVLRKLKFLKEESMVADENLPDNLTFNLKYEEERGYPRISQSRHNIDLHFSRMKEFLKQLP